MDVAKYFDSIDKQVLFKIIKRKIKDKVKYLTKKIKNGEMTTKEAKKYLAGYIGYINIADVKNLTDKLFYSQIN